MFLKIKHTEARKATPSMCILSLPGSCSDCESGGSVGSFSQASGTRNSEEQAVRKVKELGLS